MKFSKVLVLGLAIAFAFGINLGSAQAATSPDLSDAASYAVLAGSIVTNTNATTITGNVGVSPSIGVAPHITGFPPGVINAPGTTHDADISAFNAQASNTAAFGYIDQGCTTTYGGVQDLAGLSLVPGVYCSTGSFILTDDLTLEGSGVWIFKSASTIITSPGSSVIGGDPCNVWWRAVSSVTLDTTTAFIGNVLASTAITMNNGATLNGRVLAQTAAVTLDANVINNATCTFTPAPTHGGSRANTVSTTTTTTDTTIATSTAVDTALTSTSELPQTGNNPVGRNMIWYIIASLVFVVSSSIFVARVVRRKQSI